MTEAKFVEAVGFSNLVPGSEALKLAMFIGYASGGVPGLLAALLGAILPPTILMFAAAFILVQFEGQAWMASNFIKGMAPAVGVLLESWRGSCSAPQAKPSNGARPDRLVEFDCAGRISNPAAICFDRRGRSRIIPLSVDDNDT
jgi:hypothetical protein